MEAPTDIRLIALDVDGTLAARGDEITPDTRDALHRAFDAGVHVALATGRRYRTSLRVAEALGLPVEIVCLGGALVKDAQRRTLQAHQFGAGPARGAGQFGGLGQVGFHVRPGTVLDAGGGEGIAHGQLDPSIMSLALKYRSTNGIARGNPKWSGIAG